MQRQITQILEIAEDYLERYPMEGYEETADQTYNDIFFQTRTIIENIGGRTTSLRKDFEENVSRHFTPESLSNIISILKTAELFLEDNNQEPENNFWKYIHPKVKELAKPRFDNGFYADAIFSALREANTIINNHVRTVIYQELD